MQEFPLTYLLTRSSVTVAEFVTHLAHQVIAPDEIVATVPVWNCRTYQSVRVDLIEMTLTPSNWYTPSERHNTKIFSLATCHSIRRHILSVRLMSGCAKTIFVIFCSQYVAIFVSERIRRRRWHWNHLSCSQVKGLCVCVCVFIWCRVMRRIMQTCTKSIANVNAVVCETFINHFKQNSKYFVLDHHTYEAVRRSSLFAAILLLGLKVFPVRVSCSVSFGTYATSRFI